MKVNRMNLFNEARFLYPLGFCVFSIAAACFFFSHDQENGPGDKEMG